jgi:threonylcarbamoyladenosine tRNA methylthiotransferase MtaB
MKVKFLTLGCKVNQYETQALMEEFVQLGHQITKKTADLYVINTCTVTSRADTKSKEAILRARKENPKAKIVACGCLAQLNEEMVGHLGVDYIIPQERKANLADIVLNGKMRQRDIWSLGVSEFFNQRAFIKIQDGCDNFCSFCKIPYTRGQSRSRVKADVITEVKKVSLKHRELVLCGVNLGLYGRDFDKPHSLSGLLKEILSIKTLGRVRLSSLEPNLIDEELLSLLAHPKLCSHLHLPFQSGDDEVLKEMNKKETVALYEDIVGKARKVDPDTAISCDIMVGFPAENQRSFENTVEFLKRIRPMRMHIFSFSPRENTPLFKTKIKDQRLIKQRHDLLKKLHNGFSLEYKMKFLSKALSMVAEQEEGGFICGYTENYIKVYIKDKVPLGEIISVRIERIDNGKIVGVTDLRPLQ